MESLALKILVPPVENLAKNLEILRRVLGQPLEGKPKILFGDRRMPGSEGEIQPPPERPLGPTCRNAWYRGCGKRSLFSLFLWMGRPGDEGWALN